METLAGKPDIVPGVLGLVKLFSTTESIELMYELQILASQYCLLLAIAK